MKIATIDVGGTFTDCLVMGESGEVREFKVLSTPPDYTSGLIGSLEKAAGYYGMSLSEFLGEIGTIIHGTTVASNALLTGEGSRTGMITTKGFRDIYEMRRGIKLSSMYNLFVPPYQPLVPRYLRLGVEERTLYTGEIPTPLSERDVQKAIEYFDSQGVEAVAICYLHSYVNPQNEQRTLEICNKLHPEIYCVTSHEILPVWREYERFSTTVVAAYVGPIVDRYLSTIEQRLKDVGFNGVVMIMLNSGLVQTVEKCRRSAVHMIGSGPAAAPAAGVYWGERAGYQDIISLDIGGTSSDIALITGGEIPTTNECWVGDERIAVKKVDAHVLEGGGGSIAWADSLGVLRVGPRSAGADPGPACYDRGGCEPTVTDACLLLGYVAPDYFSGGDIPLTVDLAKEAIEGLGKQLNMGVMEAASAIFTLTNSLIAGHITSVCTKRGYDPRDYSLIAGGGGGPMHSAWIAGRIDIPLVIVPRFNALYSAFGMFTMNIGREYARSYLGSAHQIDLEAVNRLYEDMENEALEALKWLHVCRKDVILSRSADMRYVGQFHEVESDIPKGRLTVNKVESGLKAFHRRHEQLYAFSMPGQEVEFLTFRLRAGIRQTPVSLLVREAGPQDPSRALKCRRRCMFDNEDVNTPIYDGERLQAGNLIRGPAVIEEATTTVLIPDGFRCTVDEIGNYHLRKRLKDE